MFARPCCTVCLQAQRNKILIYLRWMVIHIFQDNLRGLPRGGGGGWTKTQTLNEIGPHRHNGSNCTDALSYFDAFFNDIHALCNP
jgi:hypothetical protein